MMGPNPHIKLEMIKNYPMRDYFPLLTKKSATVLLGAKLRTPFREIHIKL